MRKKSKVTTMFIVPFVCSPAPATTVRNLRTTFVASVLPAPDSPLMTTDWGQGERESKMMRSEGKRIC